MSKYLRFGEGRVGAIELQRGEPGAPKLVCCAHAGGGPRAFAQLAQALPRNWSVFALEPSGRIATTGDALVCAKQIASLYAELVPREILEGSVLVGHSVGGYVALALAELLSTSFGALVLAASTPPPLKMSRTDFAKVSDDELLAWSSQTHAAGTPTIPEVARRPWLTGLRADMIAYQRFDGVAYQALEDIPTLMCAGVDDHLCRPATFAFWNELLPWGRLRWLPGGHFFVQTHAAALASQLRLFVAAGC